MQRVSAIPKVKPFSEAELETLFKEFTVALTAGLSDETQLVEAVNDLMYIQHSNNNEYVEFKNLQELETILKKLDNIFVPHQKAFFNGKDNDELKKKIATNIKEKLKLKFVDIGRPGRILQEYNFSNDEINKMQISEIILLEAAINFAYKQLLTQGLLNQTERVKLHRERIQAQFAQILRKWIEDSYQKALNKLESKIEKVGMSTNNGEIINLHTIGKSIHTEIKRLHQQDKSPAKTIELTKALNTARAAISHEGQNNQDMNTCIAIGKRLGQRSSTRILAGLFITLAGLILLGASAAVAYYTFGLAAPIYIAGFKLGVSMVTGGIAVATGAIALGTVASGTTLFKRSIEMPTIRKDFEKLAVYVTPPSTPVLERKRPNTPFPSPTSERQRANTGGPPSPKSTPSIKRS